VNLASPAAAAPGCDVLQFATCYPHASGTSAHRLKIDRQRPGSVELPECTDSILGSGKQHTELRLLS
jgi:hypothetical protein